jgi:ketosteroid isomerase-like protein
MSQENVEVAKRAFEAWIRGDLDAIFETFDPAVEWDNTGWEGWPEDQVYYRHEGVRRLFEEWLASWERFEAGADDYLDIGGDQVLLLVWQRGFGPGSKVPVRMDWALLTTVKRGLICRIDAYSDRRVALEAVGLRE